MLYDQLPASRCSAYHLKGGILHDALAAQQSIDRIYHLFQVLHGKTKVLQGTVHAQVAWRQAQYIDQRREVVLMQLHDA